MTISAVSTMLTTVAPFYATSSVPSDLTALNGQGSALITYNGLEKPDITFDFGRFESSYLGQTLYNEVAPANLTITAPFHTVDTNGQQALVAAPTLPSDVTPVAEAGLSGWLIGVPLALVGLYTLLQWQPRQLNIEKLTPRMAKRWVKKAHGKLPKVGQADKYKYDELATRQLMALNPDEMRKFVQLLKPDHYWMLRDVLIREMKASRGDDPRRLAEIVRHFLPLMEVLGPRDAWNITCKVKQEFVRLVPQEQQRQMAEMLRGEIEFLRQNNPSEAQLARAERLERAYQGLLKDAKGLMPKDTLQTVTKKPSRPKGLPLSEHAIDFLGLVILAGAIIPVVVIGLPSFLTGSVISIIDPSRP